MEKYDIVLESVSAKQEQLNAKTQEFYMNIVNNGLITSLLDAGKVFMDIINWSDSLVGKLLLIATATLSLTAGIHAFTKSAIGAKLATLNLNKALNLLKAHPVILALSIFATAIVAIDTAIDAHNKKIQESIDKAKELAEAYKNTSKEFKDNIKSLTETDSEKTSGEKYESLQEEFDDLCKGVDRYGNNLSLTNKEYERYKSICEKIVSLNPDLMDGYDSEVEAIGNKNNALQETIELLRMERREKAKEVVDNSDAILTDAKSDYDEAVEGHLATELLYKSQVKGDIKEFEEAIIDVTGNKSFTFGIDAKDIDITNPDELKQKIGQAVAELLEDPDLTYEQQSEILKQLYFFFNQFQGVVDEVSPIVEDINNAKDALANSMDDIWQAVLQSSKKYDTLDTPIKSWLTNYVIENFKIDPSASAEAQQEAKDEYEKTINNILNAISGDSDEAQNARNALNDLLTLDPNSINYDDYKIAVDKVVGFIADLTGQDAKTVKISLGFDTDDADDLKGLDNIEKKLASKFGVTVKEIEKQLGDMSKASIDALLAMDESTLQNCHSWNDLKVAIASAMSTVDEKSVFSDYADNIQSLSEKYEILTKAQDEYNQYGNITASTMKKIIDNGLLEYLSAENGQLQFNIEKLQENANESRNNAIAKLQEALFTDLCSIANGTYQESLDNTDSTNANAELQAFQTELDNTKGKALTTAGAIIAMNSAMGTDYNFSEEQKKQADAVVANYNSMVNKVNAITSNLSSGAYRSKSSSSSGKSKTETAFDNLKKQFDADEISIDTYISKMEALLKKVKKGSDEYEKIKKELNAQKLNRVENQFDRSEITIDQYISKLIELRSEYAKTSERYKELTKTINEAKADKFADQYERGIISLKEYIEELANLRDSYAKNSEEWYKYNDLINETQMDSYESQYERGEISADKYIAKLKAIQQTLEKDSELYKEIGDIIEDTLLEETEKWVEELQKSTDEIDNAISQLGEVNTVEEQVRYAELLSDKYEQVQSNISKIQEKLKDNTLTEEQRITLQEELNDLLEEEVDIRDEIEDQVRTYYENQKEQAEQQAELTKKQTLYNKEVELYGKQGKELFEYYTNKEIEALEAKKEALNENNEREQLENDILEARLKLQNALNNKTTKILKKQSDGTWQYEYSANMVEVKNAQEELANAEKALEEYDLQSQIDELNKNMQNLADQYADAEFWAEREYEQTMNAIDKAYGDIDSLVEKWMDEYGDSTTELVTSYQSLVSANNKLEQSLVNLESAIESKYETVGINKVSTKDGVKSFDTDGKIVGNGLILAHDKERVLTTQQNLYFEQLISKLPQLLKAVDVTKFGGYISSKTFGSRVSADKVNSTVIHNVNCNFPNINSTDGLQRAILELPRLALQNK